MKTASGALKAFCAAASENPADMQVFVSDLYTFTLASGVVLRWTSSDYPLSFTQGPITASSIASAGSSYAVGDTGNVCGVSFDAHYIVTSVNGSGGVTGYTLTAAGTLYQTWAVTDTEPDGAQPGGGSGFQLAITSAAVVTFDALTPSKPGVPAIKRSHVRQSVGLSVDDLTIDLLSSPLVQVNGVLMQSALRTGAFDGATVLVQRLIQKTPGDTSLGTYTVFLGTVGDIQNIGEASCKMSVNALTEILSNDMPRNLVQPGCRNTLFDPGCTLVKSSFTVSGTVAAGSTVISVKTGLSQAGGIGAPVAAPTLGTSSPSGCNLGPRTYYVTVTYVSALGETTSSPESSISLAAKAVLTVSSPPALTGAISYNVYVGVSPGDGERQSVTAISIGTGYTEPVEGITNGTPPPENSTNGYFSQGVITFTSGANNGQSAYVAQYDGDGTVHLLVSLPAVPTAGDTFTIVPGCDKQQPTCLHKYNNLINFGGTPFVPTPEAVF